MSSCGQGGDFSTEEGNPAGLSSCSGGLRPLVELCVPQATDLSDSECAGGCDGAQSAAKRSYPTSEARGRNWETPCPRGGGQEELTHVR